MPRSAAAAPPRARFPPDARARPGPSAPAGARPRPPSRLRARTSRLARGLWRVRGVDAPADAPARSAAPPPAAVGVTFARRRLFPVAGIDRGGGGGGRARAGGGATAASHPSLHPGSSRANTNDRGRRRRWRHCGCHQGALKALSAGNPMSETRVWARWKKHARVVNISISTFDGRSTSVHHISLTVHSSTSDSPANGAPRRSSRERRA